MIDKAEMRSHLENMERAATQVLQQDAAFFEALQALKWEIESDLQVRSAVNSLQCAGRRVFTSFVPYINVRVKTEEGVFALPRFDGNQSDPAPGPESDLTQDLKNAATAAILSSRTRQQLDTIVQEAIGSSDTFETIASEIERKGYQVLICVDLSAYAQVRQACSRPCSQQSNPPKENIQQASDLALSRYDLNFMKSLKIKLD